MPAELGSSRRATTPLHWYPRALERATDVALRRAQSDAHQQLDDVVELAARAARRRHLARHRGERRRRRGGRIAAEQDVGGLVGRLRRLRAVHQLGQLARQRPLADAALGRLRGARRSSPAPRRAAASRTAAGSRRSRRRRPGSRTGGTGTGLVLSGSSHTAPPVGLAELGAVALQQQRPGEAVRRLAGRLADQVDAGGDVAPLVGAAHLQLDAVRGVEVPEVVGLQQHVAELGVRDAGLAGQPGLAPTPWPSSG